MDHVIDLVSYSHGLGPGWEQQDESTQLAIHSRHCSTGSRTNFSVLYGGPDRHRYSGDAKTEHAASLIPHATVISNRPGRRVEITEVNERDVLVFAGRRWLVHDERARQLEYAQLVDVTDAPDPAELSLEQQQYARDCLEDLLAKRPKGQVVAVRDLVHELTDHIIARKLEHAALVDAW